MFSFTFRILLLSSSTATSLLFVEETSMWPFYAKFMLYTFL